MTRRNKFAFFIHDNDKRENPNIKFTPLLQAFNPEKVLFCICVIEEDYIETVIII